MAGAAAAALVGSYGRSGLTSLSLFSSTFASTTSIAWPGSLQAGDVAVLTDGAQSVGAQTAVYPSGFTTIVDASGGGFAEPRVIESYRILDGSESGSVTGMAGSSVGKLLRIFRGNVAIASVTPSTWNSQATSGDPSSQVVSAPGTTPAVVLGLAFGSNGSAAFSTASPAFDATQQFGTGNVMIGGYKIYNSSPAAHTVDMVDNNVNVLTSGSLTFA